MYCLKCGAQIADGEAFCSACGAPVSAQPQQPAAPYGASPARPRKNKNLPLLIGAAVAVVAVVVLLIVLLGGSGGASTPEDAALEYAKAYAELQVEQEIEWDDRLNSFKHEDVRGEETEIEILDVRVTDKDKLSKDWISDREEYYEEEYDVELEIDGAYCVEVKIKYEIDGETDTTEREVYVVEIDGDWYVA